MAAGENVYVGTPSGKVVVDMTGIEGGTVINKGTISAPDGQIVLAAGDIYSIPLQDNLDSAPLKVESGSGRVGQFGTLSADGTTGDGGSITMTAGETVVLGSESLTTANAGANGNGGDIIVYSPDTALFREDALVEAKGGSLSGNGGFFEISGKKDVEIMGTIDLTGTQDGTFLIDPLNLTIVADGTLTDGYQYVEEDPANTWLPISGGISQIEISKLEEFLGAADVTLSTIGTDGSENGDITFDANRYLTSGLMPG
jgi:hypothetical protein